MAQESTWQHPMKMVGDASRSFGGVLQGDFRCHEHGMDRERGLGEVARHFNPVNAT